MGEAVFGVPMLFWKILNLLVVIGIFWYLLREKGPLFFRGRRDSIKDQLQRAEREKEAAQNRLKELEAQFAGLADKLAHLQEEAKKEAVLEAKKLEKEAQEERTRLLERFEMESARRLEEAKERLVAEVVEKASKEAKHILENEMKPKDQQRLVREFVERVGEAMHGR